MADDKNKLNSKEIEELRKLIRLLQKEISDIDFKNLINSGEAAKSYLESLRKESKDLNDNFNNASFSFKKIVQEIKNSDEGLKSASKSFNKLSEITEKVKLHQSGISKLSTDEIKNLQKQVAQEKQRLIESDKFLNNKTAKLNSHLKSQEQEISKLINKNNRTKEEDALLNKLLNEYERIENELSKTVSIHRQVKAAIDDEDKSLEALDKTLESINKDTKDFNTKIASTQGLVAGINKIPFLSGAINTDKVLEAANDKIDAGGTKTQVLGTAFKNLGSQIKGNLINPITIAVTLVKQFIDAFVASDKAAGDLAKSFDMTYQGAVGARRELTDIANKSMDVAVTTKGLQESMMAIGQALGVNAQLNEKDLVTFTKLREQAGFTNDELVGIQKITLATGGSLEDNAKSFMGTVAKMNAQNKLAINAKQLLKEVANVSDAIKLSVGGTAAKLAEAAFKAKQFGVTLQQADQISEKLLNFEQSLADELSAELITGKDLNFEKARLLALNGDIAGASAEILKQVGGTAEFSKMNRIQQEAIAKAVGMSREDLAKSLVDREAAAKLGAKEGQSAQDRYNELVKQYGVEKASQMLGDESLARQFQQQSMQERFTQAVEKLKEVFVSIAEPIMQIISPIVDILSPVLGVISGVLGTIAGWFGSISQYLTPIIIGVTTFVGLLKTMEIIKTAINAKEAIFGTLMKNNMVTQAAMKAKAVGMAIVDIVKGAWSSLGPIPFVGAALAAAAIATGVGFLMAKKGDDVVSPGASTSGYGSRMLLGPEGAISLNNKDTVIAGTNLFSKGDDVMSAPKGAFRITPPPSPAIAAASATTSVAKQNNSDIINELRALKSEQSKTNSKPTVVENTINGTKFGTAVAMNTYKTQ